MGSSVSRRTAIAGAVLSPALATANARASDFDLASPIGGHRANVKLRGTLTNGWVWRVYSGDVFAALPQGAPVPLFRFQGAIKAQWTDNGDGTHTEVLYDVSSYLDWNSGAPLKQFVNPITKETNDVIHVWDGPTLTTYSQFGMVYPWTRTPPTVPVVLPWQVQSGRAWLSDSASFERPHPLDPKEWPKASSGNTTVSLINTTISGELREIIDDSPSAPHDLRWTSMRSWLPWLELGQRPGLLLTIGTGRKLAGPSEIPAGVMASVTAQQPNFVASERPWTEPLNSWERYKRSKSGVR